MNSNAIKRKYDLSDEIQTGELMFEADNLGINEECAFECKKTDLYALQLNVLSFGSELSQNTAIIYVNGEYKTSFTVRGTDGEVLEILRKIELLEGTTRITVQYPKNALSIIAIKIYQLISS